MLKHWWDEMKWRRRFWNKQKETTVEDPKSIKDVLPTVEKDIRPPLKDKEGSARIETKPAVAAAIDTLAGNVSYLQEMMKALESRLKAVSRPVAKAEETRPSDPPHSVPVANAIYTQAERVRGLSLLLEEIFDTLEV